MLYNLSAQRMQLVSGTLHALYHEWQLLGTY